MTERDRPARADRWLEGAREGDQDVPGWSGRLMVWLRVAAQLVAVQAFVLLGALAGGLVLGVAPALAAGSSLLARLVRGDSSDSVWHDFWAEYRRQFWRASAVMWPGLLVVGAAWYELVVLQSSGSGPLVAVLSGAVIVALGYAFACLAYAPSVLHRYTDPVPATMRFVLVAPLLSPLTALGVAVTVSAFVVIGVRYPQALVLAGVSVPLLLTGVLVDRFLDRVDARNDDDEPEES